MKNLQIIPGFHKQEAVVKVAFISDETFWKNMSIATKKIGLTPLDGYIFMNVTEFTYDILIFILLVSTVSQLGDIVISYFKRLSKVKDTGNIIPGHGGLLDRIDGMIFAFPFSYIILKLNLFQHF